VTRLDRKLALVVAVIESLWIVGLAAGLVYIVLRSAGMIESLF
jgi:hypothetical protein